MTRRRAALLAAVVALLLGTTYLLTRRRQSLPELVPTPPSVPPIPPSPRQAAEEAEPTAAIPTQPDAVAPKAAAKPAPRSWGTSSRALPARVPPAAQQPVTAAADDEQPLPTWVRAAIVAVALVAFFAVSLIATKQV